MTPQTRRLLVGALLVGLVEVACTTTRLIDPPLDDLPANPSRTEADVANAIKQAGMELGWEIQEGGPGQMTATLRLRTHVAVVSIPFDANHFEIHYKDSENLDHEGDLIHRNYNRWVHNLDIGIRRQLGYE